MSFFRKVSTFLVITFLHWVSPAVAKVNVLSFDSSIAINPRLLEADAISAVDSIMAGHPMLSGSQYVTREHLRLFYDNTFDFYLVLSLLALFGIMRFANPRYFQYLLRAFRSPSFSSQQLKDQISTSGLANLLMNIFFAASAGVYVYFIFKLNMPQRYAVFRPSLLVAILILSFVGLYGVKYLVMLFSGWVFNVRSVINSYMYNVFLINKVISILLLPFIILLAFAQPTIALPAMIVSLCLVVFMFVNRYIRSWQLLGAFFQYSKFHFFAYLCASELLPMALLTKLLIRGVYY